MLCSRAGSTPRLRAALARRSPACKNACWRARPRADGESRPIWPVSRSSSPRARATSSPAPPSRWTAATRCKASSRLRWLQQVAAHRRAHRLGAQEVDERARGVLVVACFHHGGAKSVVLLHLGRQRPDDVDARDGRELAEELRAKLRLA